VIGQTIQNRYRIDSELGRGGMGVVYRAHDAVLNRPVAVKVLSATGLGTAGKARLLAEAQAVAQLNHPNIVNVYDAGEAEGGVPFIVMELVEGAPLRQHQPQGFDEMIALARQMCAALEHAHASGIIHRDLKPENIVLTKSQTVKLMDFGLARTADAPRLTEEGSLVGTFSYLAPELIMGQPASPQSDLYALGVMLYELTTGQPPFTGENLMAVLSQHLHATVVPPSTHNPAIPPALETLTLRLLSKQPSERPASAAEVREALERIERGEPTPTVEMRLGASLLDRVVRGRLVAREREFEEARALWQRASAASGDERVLLISGEPGIGKTRLVRELTTLAEVSGAAAFVGECFAEGGAPYAPIAQIVQAALVEKPGFSEKPGFLPPLVLADLITLAPSLRARFPDVPPNPPLDPQAEQQRLFESMVALCAALTAHRGSPERGDGGAPLLLVVDDAHWADGGTLFLLRHLAHRARRMRLLILLTYREVELDEARALNEVLLDLNRERLAARIKLSRFTREQTRDLLAVMFAEDITPEFLDGIYRETEGNPFFVEEVCKALIEEGKLSRENGRWSRPSMSEIQVPQSVRVAIQARVSRLPAPAQDALRLAAVIGREFDFDVLRRAGSGNGSAADEDALIEALELAERAQLIAEAPRGRGRQMAFVFAHALIPATLRESVSGLRRQRLHRRVLAALEALRPDDFETLAYQAAHAGDEERALAYYVRAGDRARRLFANEDAIRFYSEALALIPDDHADRFDLLAARAKVYDLVGRRDEQRADVDAMLALAEKLNDDARRFEALIALADYYLETEYIHTREPAERAAGIARALNDPVREGHALRRLGDDAWQRADYAESRRLLEAAVARFREAGQPVEAAICLHGLALTLGRMGELSASQNAAEEALALSRAAGDKRQEATSLRRLAIAYINQSQYAKALPVTQAALALHRVLGDRANEANALNNLGIILFQVTGRAEEAEASYRQALDLAEAIGLSLTAQFIIINWSDLFYAGGDYAGALAFLEAQLAKAASSKDEVTLAFVNFSRAAVLADLGQYAAALDAAQAGLPIIERHLSRYIQVIAMALIGRWQAELGNWAQARSTLEAALARAEQAGTTVEIVEPLVQWARAAWLNGEQAELRAGLAHAQRAIALATEINNNTALAYGSVTAALLCLALNQSDEALTHSVKALEVIKAAPDPSYQMEIFFFTHSRALRAAGREAEADDYLRKAHARVMLVASKIADEALRRSWLENVRLNREMLEEWAARGL
jgi:predicted ATPase/predicted Ser/Thr protein kinase